MKRYCLIGHPLGHSISPEIHMRLFALAGIEAKYVLDDVAPEALAAKANELRGLDGFNVTIPHKQTVMPLLDSLSESAVRFRSVNTVICSGGKMTGCNTDAEGFLDALADGGIELRGRVLLCGAGGVSAMMGTQALIHGCALTVAARTIGKAARFVDALKASFPGAQVDAAALPYLSGSYDLILNGTPAGMYPETKVSPVPSAVARSAKAVFDAIYNPCETQLMKTAREAGAKTVGGLRMLVRQAAAAQKLWNSSEFTQADIDRLCEEMAAYISEKF